MRYYYSLCMLLLLGCHAGAAERKVSAEAFSASIAEAANHAENLHRINISDIEGLKSNLQKNIAIDVKNLWSMIKAGDLSKDEKSRAYGVLLLIAVQNEKFPNQDLSSDKELLAILHTVLDSDPQKTEEVRSRNWQKPWWAK